MRLTSTTIIALTAVLFSGAASAADGQKDKGSTAPTAGGASPGGGKSDNPTDTRDRPTDTTFSNKTWDVGVGLEYHHLLNAGTYTNNASSNNINYYTASARWDPSPYDRISVRWGVYESFLVDQGEPGIRADDIIFAYTRRIPLPEGVTVRPSFSITAPVGYSSQLSGLITSPRLSLEIDKRFGKYFTLDGRISGSYYVVKYAEGGFSYTGGGNSEGTYNGLGANTGGATPSSRAALSLALSADLAMPFHEPLGLGLAFFTGYSWYYDVSNGGNCPPGTPSTVCMYGTEMQPTGQPMQQRYGAEIYVHYQFPTVGGFKSDALFAFAPLGDPTLGYTGVLHGNGAASVQASYFSNMEVYAAVSARY